MFSSFSRRQAKTLVVRASSDVARHGTPHMPRLQNAALHTQRPGMAGVAEITAILNRRNQSSWQSLEALVEKYAGDLRQQRFSRPAILQPDIIERLTQGLLAAADKLPAGTLQCS